MASDPIRGSCLCGGIAFEVSGRPIGMAYCHCSRCRKAGGLANVLVAARDFRWVRGAELVKRYTPEPPWNLVRCFCEVCGTYLGEPETHPKAFSLSAHTFDDDPRVRPILHEQTDAKPAWYEITDGLPQYPGAPPPDAFFPKTS